VATNDPQGPGPTTTRTTVNVVEHRRSGGLWAVLIIVVLAMVAAGLYFAGVFNGRPLYSEKNKVDIKVHAPAAGGGATTP
jgi:hypothetical protein